MSNWTYTSKVDMTNGGGDDLTDAIIASGLPSGILEVEILYTLVSTNSENQALLIRFGDSTAIEITDYDCSMQNASSIGNGTVGFFTCLDASMDSAQSVSGVMRIFRWDVSEHLWLMKNLLANSAQLAPRISAGYKTLSGELAQIQATTEGGTATFDGGEIRMRYM